MHLSTLPLGFSSQRWSFLADHIAFQQHMLTGASTAFAYRSEPNRSLGTLVSIRDPYNAAIHDLDLAAVLF